MRVVYETAGSCASRIIVQVEDGHVVEALFVDGCPGNTRGLSALVAGMEVGEAIRRLKGIPCQGSSSCPDQLAKALETTL